MKPTVARTHAWLAALLVGLMLGPQRAAAAEGEPAAPESLTGAEAAKRMDDARRAKTEHNVMTMSLENARGQQRVRTIEGWSREVSEEEDHRFARFLEPADVKDTTLLTYDFDHVDDDIWLYLPALKKVKRILSSNKTDYFMGSDFTYWDMENIDLVNWDYQLAGSEQVDGVDCHVLEAKPKNAKEIEESGYHKVVYWIGKNDWLARKIEYTDTKDRLSKRLTLSEIRPTSERDPRPRAHKLLMDNLFTKHKTTLAMSKLELDVAVNDTLFSQRNMMP
jgi:hypothetical protein